MKPQTICCLAVLLLATAPSAGTEEDNTTPELSEGSASVPSKKAKEERSAPGEDETSTPYEPFVPSESISGDSSVAFPVDI